MIKSSFAECDDRKQVENEVFFINVQPNEEIIVGRSIDDDLSPDWLLLVQDARKTCRHPGITICVCTYGPEGDSGDVDTEVFVEPWNDVYTRLSLSK